MTIWLRLAGCLAELIAIGLAYLLARSNGYAKGYARGLAAGRLQERQALTRLINGEGQRALAAERGIDYLYERARQEIRSDSPSPPGSDSRDEPAAGS